MAPAVTAAQSVNLGTVTKASATRRGRGYCRPSVAPRRGTTHTNPRQQQPPPQPQRHCRRRSSHRHTASAASDPAAAASNPGSGSGTGEPTIDVTYERLDRVGLPDDSMDPKVQEALLKVQQALAEAEQSMQTLHTLPSARLPTAWDRLLSTLRPAAQFGALTAACAALHSLGTLGRVLGSLAIAAGIGGWGWRKSSLSGSGAAAAVLVGWGTLGASFRSGLLLLAFFFSSSKLTQFGEEMKDVDEEHKKGGQRDWRQVFCNALVPTCLALAAAHYGGGADLALGIAATSAVAGADVAAAPTWRLLTALHGAFLGYYACCCGDTWASELGQLSPEEPRLITNLRPVRKGTNGGVTLLGLGASLAGGLSMGLTFLLATAISPTGAGLGAAAAQAWRVLALGVGSGLVGSLIDSLLGATIQFTGYNRTTGKITGRPGPDVSPISGSPLLDNNAVNAVSASTTAALAGLASVACF